VLFRSMLLNDENYVQERVQWLRQTQKNNSLEDIDRLFYVELEKQLQEMLGIARMGLLQSVFDQVRSALTEAPNKSEVAVVSEPEDELNLASFF